MSDKAVKQITTDDLRRMENQDGLIFHGCGGDPQEWVDGINGLLTEAEILLEAVPSKRRTCPCSSMGNSPICCSPLRA